MKGISSSRKYRKNMRKEMDKLWLRMIRMIRERMKSYNKRRKRKKEWLWTRDRRCHCLRVYSMRERMGMGRERKRVCDYRRG